MSGSEKDEKKQTLFSAENKRKTIEALKKGLKTSFSMSNSKSEVAKTIKSYTYTLLQIIKDFGLIFKSLLLILYSVSFGMIISIAMIKKESKKAATNNFKLGLESLNLNNLTSARMRFLLSNIFYGKSATTKYYIAYTYFLSQNYKMCLKYIKKAISINQNHKKSIDLMKKVEKELHLRNK